MTMFFTALTGETPAISSPQAMEQYLSAMAKGDQQALASFYQDTRAAAYGFALSILKNRQDAEDAMQETYVKAFWAAGSYRPQGKPMAWLLTIVRNLCLMRLRKAGRESGLPDAAEWQAAAPPERTEDRLLLEAALTILSAEERQIVLLHSIADLKQREIAALLQLPLSTTLSKYRRALTKLRNHLRRIGE